MFSNSFSPAKRSGGRTFSCDRSWNKCSAKVHEHWLLISNMFHCHPYQKSYIYRYIQSWFSIDVDSWDRLNPNRGTKGTCAWSVLDGLYFRATGSPDTCHGRDFAKDASCSTCPTGAAATSLATGHHGPCDHGTPRPWHPRPWHRDMNNPNPYSMSKPSRQKPSLWCDGKGLPGGEWCKWDRPWSSDHHPYPARPDLQELYLCGQNHGLRWPRANFHQFP